jgi:hypothetical protein
LKPDGRLRFKFTDFDGRDAGVKGHWNLPAEDKPAKWMPDVVGPLGGIGIGYRLVNLAGLSGCVGRELYQAEGTGDSICDGSVAVYRRARLVQRCDGWNESVARDVVRLAAFRVAEYYSCHLTTLGEIPIAIQDTLFCVEKRDWLGMARDDLRLCAGLIANGARRTVVTGNRDAEMVNRVRLSAYQEAMNAERGQQSTEILMGILSD